MRIMGLDVGSKTVGVAISDPLGFTAQGLEIIQIDEEQGQFGFERLGALVSEYKVDKFVIGLPKNMNNTIGPQGEKVLSFVDELKDFLVKNSFDIEIVMQDERLTTVSAERILIEGNMSRKKRKKVIDKVAATYILQSYLDRK